MSEFKRGETVHVEPHGHGYDYGDYTPMKWMDGYETFIHYLDGRIVGKHQ